jgi:hypothetical protein
VESGRADAEPFERLLARTDKLLKQFFEFAEPWDTGLKPRC